MVQIPFAARLFTLFMVLIGLYFAAPNFFPRSIDRVDDEGQVVGQDCFVPWPFVCRQINLGLDLQGGAFASFEVAEEAYWRSVFRDEQLSLEALALGDDERFWDLLLDFTDLQSADDGGWIATFDILADINAQDLAVAHTAQPFVQVRPTADNQLILQVSGTVREQNLLTLTNRLIESLRTRFDAFGISEPIIRPAGPPGRVYVELPGAEGIPDVPPGNLRICSVPTNFSGATGAGIEYYPAAEPGTDPVRFADRIAVDRTQRCVETADIIGAAANIQNEVEVTLRPSAGEIMRDLTRTEWSSGPAARYIGTILDGRVLRIDSFEPNLGTRFVVRGIGSVQEAATLATILRAGALPAEITKLEESKVGPELGAQAVAAGQWAALLAVAAVFLYMMVSYGLFGLFANVALIVNLILILGIMSLLGFTLSLPGIAGLVLTIGMAVDANVLVFERMREVWRRTGNVGQAIENGYAQALSTIVDANITTFIAAVVLFNVGKGAIQGFAVTLSIGILSSIFCALLLTRMLIGFWYGGGRRLMMPI